MLFFHAAPPPEPLPPPPGMVVHASVESEPVGSAGDAADDPAIWVHPTMAERSLVLGTDKRAGLAVYDLGGNRVQFFADGRLNNVDLRDGFRLADGRTVSLAAATQRDERSIVLYTIAAIPSPGPDAPAAEVRRVPTAIPTSLKEPYGVAMYCSPVNGDFYVFATDKQGAVQQFRLSAVPGGEVSGTLVREFHVGSIAEGMVADDIHRCLYISEEEVAVWKYPAEPEDDTPRTVMDLPRPRGHFAPDAEGLAIIQTSPTDGFLVLSSQGDSTFSLYRRLPPHTFVVSFSIGLGAAGIDGVCETDGLDVCASPLGPSFPEGIIVAQDGDNSPDPQNFKFVSLADVHRAVRALPGTSPH